jgi:hypothetical protein
LTILTSVCRLPPVWVENSELSRMSKIEVQTMKKSNLR